MVGSDLDVMQKIHAMAEHNGYAAGVRSTLSDASGREAFRSAQSSLQYDMGNKPNTNKAHGKADKATDHAQHAPPAVAAAAPAASGHGAPPTPAVDKNAKHSKYNSAFNFLALRAPFSPSPASNPFLCVIFV